MGEDGGLNHILVPKHELLSKEDSEKVLKELGVKLWQLPRIYQDDPAIRHLNPEVGQLVKITRSSELAGEYVVYRVVVSSLTAKSTTTEKKEEKAEKRKTKEKSATKSRTTSKSRKRKRASRHPNLNVLERAKGDGFCQTTKTTIMTLQSH
ncbi:hypothetical protein B9Q02_02680 [Candidatus Marsarchaeota G1 archaeon BE_D]|uniref:DNA-directed RNA polymerase subunit Rpo5 n=1 Tax=Candidatus Marsarchaeota G1 archaeon BE_D TaxID=1978156 RepID=A0A2R6AIY9_9ARCH|nr:MAG: hypothetical protein B9Q02_02680 [Candidatus Marsarchaeota G1 archaeon BE_D]